VTTTVALRALNKKIHDDARVENRGSCRSATASTLRVQSAEIRERDDGKATDRGPRVRRSWPSSQAGARSKIATPSRGTFTFKDFNEAFGFHEPRRSLCGESRPSSRMVERLTVRFVVTLATPRTRAGVTEKDIALAKFMDKNCQPMTTSEPRRRAGTRGGWGPKAPPLSQAASPFADELVAAYFCAIDPRDAGPRVRARCCSPPSPIFVDPDGTRSPDFVAGTRVQRRRRGANDWRWASSAAIIKDRHRAPLRARRCCFRKCRAAKADHGLQASVARERVAQRLVGCVDQRLPRRASSSISAGSCRFMT